VSAVDRVVLVACLKAGERERAEKLLADGVEPSSLRLLTAG